MSAPRINLRRAASYTLDKGPLSSTSARFSFNHLLFMSPPPSPGLPQLLPRPRRRSSAVARPSRIFRVLLLLSSIVILLYVAIVSFWPAAARSAVAETGVFAWPTVLQANREAYEMARKDRLPRHPTPAIVSDQNGHAVWTVSIPPNSQFPLAANDYVDMCAKCRAVAAQVDETRRKGHGISSISILPGLGDKSRKRTMVSAKHFVDVHEAELAGYLAGSVSIATLMNQQDESNDLVGQPKGDGGGTLDRPVCARSMTFVLPSADAGLGRTLMLLWVSYALAESENRSFFIDDTRWAHGRYMDIFAAPPTPACRPPLRHEMLPCPRAARHLAVTVETAGELFDLEDDDTTDTTRTAHLFALARRGYEALYQLNAEDAQHVADRAQELRNKTKKGAQPGDEAVGTIVGVHVRRGDQHPLEFQYRDSYTPLNLYADRAHGVLEAAHNGRTAEGQRARSRSFMLVASDDPTVYDAKEFAGATRAQEFIRLAGKTAAASKQRQQVSPPTPGAMRKFEDETFGWEGGFFSAMFWNLGRTVVHSTALSPAKTGARTGESSTSQAAVYEPPSADTLRLRSLIGRAYMLDLAVLAEASDAIVCAVSSTGCRLLAVMMGREAAEIRGKWINVDGNYGWWAVDFDV